MTVGAGISIGICDDEKEVRDYIRERVLSFDRELATVFFASGEEVLQAELLPDILFLDIDMPGLTGLETAKQLRAAGKDNIVIFITALEEYVYNAFDVGAFHYLVKPFHKAKFYEVLARAVKQAEEKKLSERTQGAREQDMGRTMVIKNGRVRTTVLIDSIVFAEVFDRKIILHIAEGAVVKKLEYYGKLRELADTVSEDFFRIHRAYLVNMRYVSSYDADRVFLFHEEIPIARGKYADFVKAYLHYNFRKTEMGD